MVNRGCGARRHMSTTAKPVMSKVGLLACGGGVPVEIAALLRASDRPYHVVAIAGVADPSLGEHPSTWVGLGELGGMLSALSDNGCEDLLVIGALTRPDLTKLGFDLGAFRHARAIYSLTRGGDDSMLRRIVRFFEGQGFRVIGPADVAPEMIAPSGRIAGPDAGRALDGAIRRGRAAIAALSEFDVGQAVVTRGEGVIGVEDQTGTRGLLASLEMSQLDQAATSVNAGAAVLVKLPKRGQELRIDMPTIGNQTITSAKAAGLRGIAVAAGATLMAGRAALASEAERHRISVLGIDGPGDAADEGADGAVDSRSESDEPRARAAVETLADLVAPEIANWAVLCRRSHVQVVTLNGLPVPLRLRLARLSRGWGVPSFNLWQRTGALVIGLRAAAAPPPDPGESDALAQAIAKLKLGAITCVIYGEDGPAANEWRNWFDVLFAPVFGARTRVSCVVLDEPAATRAADVEPVTAVEGS